jgi:hypothetical protein
MIIGKTISHNIPLGIKDFLITKKKEIMVGAKQFAIGRKIIEAQEANPIVKSIRKYSADEQDFKNESGSFLDRFKLSDAPKKSSAPKKEQEHMGDEVMALFNKSPLFKMMKPYFEDEIKETEEEEASEELIDMISGRVFQKIKCYLNGDNDMNLTNNRKLKLEINF